MASEVRPSRWPSSRRARSAGRPRWAPSNNRVVSVCKGPPASRGRQCARCPVESNPRERMRFPNAARVRAESSSVRLAEIGGRGAVVFVEHVTEMHGM